MKYSNKITISIVILTIFMIVFSLYGINSLKKTADNLNNYIIEIENNTVFKNWANASIIIKDLKNNWVKERSTWAILIDHNEIDNIDISIEKISKYIETKNNSLALVEIATLKLYIKHIP